MRFALFAVLILPVSAFAAELPPNYSQHVAAILDSQSVTCHRSGEIGPFSMVNYEDAKKRAKQIATVTGALTMPPWKPGAGHGQFLDERKLTAEQIGTLKAWADAGAPEGDAKLRPKPPMFKTGWKLGKPDLVMKMPEAFKISATGHDIYHHFVFPMDLKKDTYLVGVECRPGNPKVAHHAVGILDPSGTARKLEKKHKGPGYPGNGPGFLPAGFTPGYIPGQTPRFFKEGTAITLKPATDFVLQMHYHPSGKEETDQTEIAFYFSPKPPTNILVVVAMASNEIDIPAGKVGYAASDTYTTTCDFLVQDIWAHMHLIGKTVNVTAETPDGKTRTLLKISEWDFNWQDTYSYKKPFRLPKGTKIRADFSWDNSGANPHNPFSPPKRIRLGEGSGDEMSGLIIGAIADNWVDALGHWAATIGHYADVTLKGVKYAKSFPPFDSRRAAPPKMASDDPIPSGDA